MLKMKCEEIISSSLIEIFAFALTDQSTDAADGCHGDAEKRGRLRQRPCGLRFEHEPVTLTARFIGRVLHGMRLVGTALVLLLEAGPALVRR